MEVNFNTYRLINGKTKGAWELPLKTQAIKDKNGTPRKIAYVPGERTFFLDEIKSQLPKEKVWFDDGKIRVPKDNKLLNDLLQNHDYYNKYYALEDKEAEAKSDVAFYQKRSKANRLIEEYMDDKEKTKACALSVFGLQAMPWSSATASAQLYKRADQSPDLIIKAMEAKDSETKYLAALAIEKKVVKINGPKTAIVWAMGDEGVIVPVAKGESPFTKLTEFLSQQTEEAVNTFQEIGNRLDNKTTNKQTTSSRSNSGRTRS